MSLKKGRQKEKLVYVVKSDENTDAKAANPLDSGKESKPKDSVKTTLAPTSSEFVPQKSQNDNGDKQPIGQSNRRQGNNPKKAHHADHQQKNPSHPNQRDGDRSRNYNDEQGYVPKKRHNQHDNQNKLREVGKQEDSHPFEEQKTHFQKDKRKEPNHRGGRGSGHPNTQNGQRYQHEKNFEKQDNSQSKAAGDQGGQGNRRGQNRRRPNHQNEEIGEVPALDKRTESSMTSKTDNSDIDFGSQTDLSKTLEQRLTSGKIECPICYNNIRQDASIWSCGRCYGPFHLKCIKQWIENNQINKDEAAKYKGLLENYIWTCPKCNYLYSEEMPAYKCFCLKHKNPEHDSYLTPHSCGENCGKLRGASCVHPCNETCHPGPCPPCNLFGKTKICYCGKVKVQVKCSDPDTGIECGATCDKPLKCQNHTCASACHPGPCPPCHEKVLKSCYCGKNQMSLNCGEEVYSCQQVCTKTLDCGNHKCLDPCHAGPCKPCLLTPEKLKNCPCNKIPISALGAGNRKSCLDPIPSCGLPCGKKLICGHSCKSMCHIGPCSNCKEVVEQQCRCQITRRKIECHKVHNGEPDERLFICERICRKKKSCGQHKCLTPCCGATKEHDPEGRHLCIKVCEKPLNCNKHTCDLFCHLGGCPPCPVIINHPLTCACGAAVKNPPLQCGTHPPSCTLPCTRTRPCGHPCHSNCHFDTCPPCHEPVEKVCNCGKSVIKNVKCSMEVLCGKACENVLACGHACGIICHKGDCDWNRGIVGCGKRCGKERVCGHLCTAPCHPGVECPTEKCKVEIRVACDCGNRETFVSCGATDKLEHKSLKCDKTCANLQRFGALYSKDPQKKAYYPASLVRFAKADLPFILKLETFIEKFLKEGKGSTTLPLHDRNPVKKSAMQILLSKHYNLKLELHTNYANPIMYIASTDQTMIPKVKLSEYLKKIEKKEITPEVLPFEASLRFFNLSEFDSLDELDNLLREYEGTFYIERLSEKNVVVHFWEKGYAEAAAKKLKKSFTSFANVSVEENEKLKSESDKYNHISEDVIITENEDKPSEFGLKVSRIEFPKLGDVERSTKPSASTTEKPQNLFEHLS